MKSLTNSLGGSIQSVRDVLSTLQLYGLNLNSFETIIQHIEDGRQRFYKLTTDIEQTFVEIEYLAEVRIDSLI